MRLGSSMNARSSRDDTTGRTSMRADGECFAALPATAAGAAPVLLMVVPREHAAYATCAGSSTCARRRALPLPSAPCYKRAVQLLLVIVRRYPRRTLLTLICLVLAGLAEGIGISSLLPVIRVAARDGAGNTALERGLANALGIVGL